MRFAALRVVVVGAAVAAAALLATCALSAPPASDTLRDRAVLGDLAALTQQALTAAEQAPDDVAAQLRATRRLFQAADLELQQGTVAWLRENPAASRSDVLRADDRVGDAVRAKVVSLCTRGLELAERAANAAPANVDAQLHQALHLSLLSWANGPTRAVFAGLPGRMIAAMDKALALDPTFDGGAPLRLQGRFRGIAPWPYGDVPVARTALARACELAPIPLNHLFYGDVLAAAGERDAAVEQWRLALVAEADESTRWSQDLLREQARARLAAK